MIVLFVLFDACSIGLVYEYSPILKNLISYLTLKKKQKKNTDMIFSSPLQI